MKTFEKILGLLGLIVSTISSAMLIVINSENEAVKAFIKNHILLTISLVVGLIIFAAYAIKNRSLKQKEINNKINNERTQKLVASFHDNVHELRDNLKKIILYFQTFLLKIRKEKDINKIKSIYDDYREKIARLMITELRDFCDGAKAYIEAHFLHHHESNEQCHIMLLMIDQKQNRHRTTTIKPLAFDRKTEKKIEAEKEGSAIGGFSSYDIRNCSSISQSLANEGPYLCENLLKKRKAVVCGDTKAADNLKEPQESVSKLLKVDSQIVFPIRSLGRKSDIRYLLGFLVVMCKSSKNLPKENDNLCHNKRSEIYNGISFFSDALVPLLIAETETKTVMRNYRDERISEK